MATVTPNFNWPVPTSTDLVKDGATAIEALGDSIDASLLDLKGGTTGQVLSKTTSTDMDFTWVTTDDANAIQNSIVDAKGDLISATANDTPARLAVGSNGETLVADSSTSTGLRYQVPVNVNPVLNSSFQVWQRGTTITGAAAITYTADRWMALRDAFVTGYDVSRQTTNDTTNLAFIQYCARVQRTAGNTGLQFMWMANNFESINSIPYAGKTVTLSFYARAGANYSSASNVLQARLYSGLGTDQNIATGYTGTATPIDQNATLTTTWQRFSYTGTVASAATELAIRFGYTPVGTAGANDYFEVTGVQLEVGSVATPFKTYAGTIQGELAACQRYYWRNSVATAYGTYSLCYATSTTQAYAVVNFPTAMRVIPTSIDYSSLAVDFSGVSASAVSAISGGQGTNLTSALTLTTTGLTQYRVYDLCNNNSTSGYLGFSAEL